MQRNRGIFVGGRRNDVDIVIFACPQNVDMSFIVVRRAGHTLLARVLLVQTTRA